MSPPTVKNFIHICSTLRGSPTRPGHNCRKGKYFDPRERVAARLRHSFTPMDLKADLHLHTRDGDRFIAYDARGLIDRAARDGFVTFSEDLGAYARERGILLIPGVEATIEGKHVLLCNIDVDPERIRTFADLRRRRRPEWLVVAPHPFFPASFCLRGRLLREIDLFDAIELSHFSPAVRDDVFADPGRADYRVGPGGHPEGAGAGSEPPPHGLALCWNRDGDGC